jgi:hypothetical protein
MGLMRLRGLLLGLVGVVVLGLPGVAGAAEGACSNEQLRVEDNSTLLPDCRAYEMVTPVYKEGQPVFVDGLSSDGSSAFAFSQGDLAGVAAEGISFEGAVFLDTRTAAGWQLEPVMVPFSKLVGQFLGAVEPNSDMSLWLAHTPSQSARRVDLYTRSAGGVYSLVGPLVTPENGTGEPSDVMQREPTTTAELVAATSDYGHVVLNVRPHARWPFDLTVGEEQSLYEYSGVGNEHPILVGVRGKKGSTQLLGECGTELGSGEGSVYNALSADGETVFFTLLPQNSNRCGASGAPSFAEVWARRHGSLGSAVAAESVDVSARAPEPACSGMCRVDAESGKEFEGASEDGTRVFFTSTQQLLDGASEDPEASDNAAKEGCARTTGAGGCNLYEYDFNAADGDNLRLVAGGAEVLGVARIAEDGSRVYFVAKGELTSVGNEFGVVPVKGQPNLYVYDAEEAERDPGYKPVFIATLNHNDQQDWSKRDIRPVQATADGRFLLFVSSQPGLTPGDTARTNQLFEYDAQTGELVRVTQGEDGYNENGNSAGEGIGVGPFSEQQGFTYNFHRMIESRKGITGDGMTVVFDDAGRLSARAASAEEGCTSVYEYHSSGSIADGSVHLLSDGADIQPFRSLTCGAEFLDMDASGANILFFTADPLLASDTDGVQRDVYDARVGGGFPLPAVPAGCEGDACLGVLGSPPLLTGPASMGGAGVGNLSGAISPSVVGARAKSLTRAQKLARALRACRAKHGRGRGVCEAQAHRHYGRAVKAVKANGRVGR